VKPRKAVIDTSSLILLDKAGVLEKLSVIFDQIFYPQHVKTEVTRKGKARSTRQKLSSFFSLCKVGDATRVEILKQDNVDPGEAEVIVQATERAISTVIMDDKRAQKKAHRHGLTIYDTKRVMIELDRLGLLPGK